MTATPVSSTSSINWDAFAQAIDGIELIRDAAQVAKLSKDYYTYSPILVAQLEDKVGDVVVRPTSETDIIATVKACVQQRIPLTVRGAGTGNYGQCIPLQGGVILDLSKMQAVKWIKPGMACVEPGVRLAQLDKQTRDIGWEIRMAPSTYRTATVGGFISGGSGGIGSITYGQLRDRGNVQALRVVTMEAEPRIVELRGDDIQKANHAYGTNGIITELEVPLGPAYPWADVMVAFDDFMTSARFAQQLGESDGIIKKLVSICADPIPAYFAPFRSVIPPGKHVALLMIAEPSLEAFAELVNQWGGEICYQKSAQEASKGTMLLEFTWNHTTLHARSVDPSLTYLQTLFPYDAELKLLEHMYHHFGDEVMMHLEFIRIQGKVAPAALQIVRYSTPERLADIIKYHEDQGAFIANPHTYILEDGGRKTVDPVQLAFKQAVDPHGLMNPGKMKAWDLHVSSS
ncbi:MAG: FAD-binding oxidoreductase [Kaiparowitsia implicata GSE-PSE-MK54-09C]|jgi:FAD/FMN-containing dehydrogenase|nr:FAD-binding oxidoreductase [Kaiparowitsia implicata GSE-PSE-MK54-09C]